MAFGNNPTTGTQGSLPSNQFPLSSVAVPGASGGNLTALEGGPASTDSNGNSTAPASVYVKDAANVTQGAQADTAVTNAASSGTLMAFTKGLVKILADVWDSVNHRIKVDGSGVTQPVSGTVTANAGTNLNTSTLALESGGNLATLAGTVTSAKVQANVAQINGVAPTMGNGVSGTGVQRVTIASDSTGQVVLAAGSAVIGHVINDASSAVIGGVELVDSGGTNKASISAGGAISVAPQATGSTSATMQSAASANGNGTSLTTLGYATIAFTVSGTFSATINFEGTEDNSNWSAIEVTPFNSTTPATTTTTTGSFSASCAGMQSVRARISGYASGNVTVTAHAVPLGGGGSSSGGGGGSNSSVSTTGAAVPGSATYLGGNKGGNLTGISLDGSGNLNVNVAAGGGSGGTSSSFGSAFPATGTAVGASDGTNMQGLLVESSSNKNLRVGLWDGTNKGNILPATSVSNALGSQAAQLMAGANQEVSFTTTTAQAVASTDATNYRWVSVQVTSQGGSSTVNFQGSNDNSTWIAISLNSVGSASGAFVSNTTATGCWYGALPMRYFRLNVTGIVSGTTAGVIEFHTLPGANQSIGANAAQSGTWTVQPGNTPNTTAWLMNVTQFGSNNVATGTGASGSGIPRVTVSNDSQVQLWDGTNGPAAVKAANTSPALADKALVTAISPNNTGLPVNKPVVVQSTNNKSSGSVASLAKAFTSNNTQGNSIVVTCGVGNGTAPTVSDSAGNTYTQVGQIANGTAFNVAIFLGTGATAGQGIASGANTVTVTNGGTTASIAMEIYEISGLITQVTAQPAVTATNTGSSGTASTSVISALTPNEYAFAAVGVGTAAQTITAGSGWTNDSGQQNPTTPAGLFSFVSMSQYLGSLTAVTPQATFTSEPWAIAVATFRPVLLGIEGTTKEAPASSAVLTSVAGSASSVTLFASNLSARSRMLYNDSTANLYLAYAATATTSAFTVLIPPSTLWEAPKPTYTGAISGIWASATGNARLTEVS